MNLTVTQPGHIIPTGIAGFGYSGKVFHAPFVHAHAGYRLSAFVTTGNEAAQLYPSAKIYRSFKEILAAGDLELIVLCTPHPLHVSQAIEAMRAGKHVVIEKPVAMNSRDAGKLISAASETGRQWFPYHNRRWDGDFLTVRQLISSGVLGHIVEFGSHFDRYSPVVMRAGWRYLDEDGGGTLFDLGPHLIDQTI
ncbi:MAG TPA: oxidoreductase, partial [Bacteroidales bacterium]|nr:oxidoreductase [Bacteroidales bacterium]